MKKIVYVILHYLTIQDTMKCVESILENKANNNVRIIIVDNASYNDSGRELKKIYKERDDVTVIINEKNLGFSKGNNVGFIVAKNMNADFIVLCNNDTYLIQKDFNEKIIKEYECSKFAVLGPQIILKNNKINPVVKNIPNIDELNCELKKMKKSYLLETIYLRMIYRNLKKNKIIKNDEFKNVDVAKKIENCVLHGCFLIFSRKYIDIFDGLNDKTFLFREEELLALRLRKTNLKSIYNPEIKIYHNEDSATNFLNKNTRKKELFVLKNMIFSTKILINEMKNINK